MSDYYECRILSDDKLLENASFQTDEGTNILKFKKTTDIFNQFKFETQDVACWNTQFEYLIKDFEKLSMERKATFMLVFHSACVFSTLGILIRNGQISKVDEYEYDSADSRTLIGARAIEDYYEIEE
jgi:hypothetical protein